MRIIHKYIYRPISAPVVESQQAATRLAECIKRLDRWMGQNGLKLNAEKTQLIWLGSRHQLAKLTDSISAPSGNNYIVRRPQRLT